MKSKKNLIILAIVIAISLIGITYAFFDYYMLGSNQKITAGKINLVFNEGEDTIDSGNIFPETVEKARSREDNFITFTVSGVNTTKDQDIWYEIMLNEGDPETGMTRFNPEDLVFDLVEMNADGTEGEYVVNARSFSDFNARRIWVNTVDRNNATVINKTYKLRMWLSEDVLISDSDPNANYSATGYENHYASVKVSVYGDFVEKGIQIRSYYMANLGNYDIENFEGSFWPEEIAEQTNNITEVNFVSMSKDKMIEKYNVASIKADLTDTSKSEAGSVLCWLEDDKLVTNDAGKDVQYYKMYVVSDGITYFPSDSSAMICYFDNLSKIVFSNICTKNVEKMVSMFYAQKLTSLDLSSFDTSNVTDMSYMFEGCESLTSLDLSSFDTSNVINMEGMFDYCGSLVSLDLSNFDTSRVENMNCMFEYCESLTLLDLSNFNISRVEDMSWMFYYCWNLTSIDVSSFDISNVTNINGIFCDCENLITIYANTDWSIGKVNADDTLDMFSGCVNLVGAVVYDESKTDITMANPTTGYFTSGNLANITYNANGGVFVLTDDPVDRITVQKPVLEGKAFLGWSTSQNGPVEYKAGDTYNGEDATLYAVYGDTRNVMSDLSAISSQKANIYNVYFINDTQENIEARCDNADECWDLTLDEQGSVIGWLEGNTLYIGSEGTTYLSTGYELFDFWENVEEIDFTNVDTSMVTDMSYMFNYCSSLTKLDLKAFNTSKVTNMSHMFNLYYSEITTLDVSGFDTSNVTNMDYMFYGCINVTSLNLSNFVTTKVTDMSSMFFGCQSLISLDLSNFDISSLSNTSNMFEDCSNLVTIYAIGDWQSEQISNSLDMFYGCMSLVGAVAYDKTKIDISMANTSTGYFTDKNS